jgi:hypothetical protein
LKPHPFQPPLKKFEDTYKTEVRELNAIPKNRFNKNRNLSKTRNHAHKTISIPLFWRNFSSSNRSAYISEE